MFFLAKNVQVGLCNILVYNESARQIFGRWYEGKNKLHG